MKHRHVLLLTIAGFVALVSACSSSGSATAVESVSPQVAAEKLAAEPGTVVLDIRTPEEVAAGHLPGAVNIDFYEADFEDRIAGLDRDASYVVYCRSGNRTSQARSVFEDLGFGDVIDVDGGIVAWYDAGLPVTLD